MRVKAPRPELQRRAIAWSVVAAVHLLLLTGLRDAVQGVRLPSMKAAPAMVWLSIDPPRPQPRSKAAAATADESAPPQVLRRPPDRPTRVPKAPPPQAPRAWPIPSPATQPMAINVPEPDRVQAGVVAAELPASAASAPQRRFILETEATRRAIRAAAGTESLAERAARASAEPARRSADEQLGQEIARAAHGDCLKGEFLGAGMGILSLPFWIAAEVRGKCSR
jgi:hypothetical protein